MVLLSFEIYTGKIGELGDLSGCNCGVDVIVVFEMEGCKLKPDFLIIKVLLLWNIMDGLSNQATFGCLSQSLLIIFQAFFFCFINQLL